MHKKQGSKPFTQFAKKLKRLRCSVSSPRNHTPLRACKDAIIFGTSDDKLCQEALAKDFDWATLRKAALGYEQSRKNCGQMKAPVEDTRSIYTQVEVDQIVSRVMAGKYSARTTSKDTKMSSMTKCPNCPAHYRAHEPGRCPARGKTCVVCHSKNHFAGSRT